MVNSKLIRKGLALTASAAVAFSTLVAVGTSAQAVADSASVTVPSGLRADIWYDEELHGTGHEDSTIIQGAFKGPHADDLEIQGIALIDAPDGVSEDDSEVLESDCLSVDYDNDGALFDPNAYYSYSIYVDCYYDDVMFPEPGTYKYRLTVGDYWGDIPDFTVDATIVVGGLPVSSKITGGSAAWPEQGDDFNDVFDNYFITYYDAEGRVTSLDGYDDYALMLTDDPSVEGYYDLYEEDWCEAVYQLDAYEYQGCTIDNGWSDEYNTVFVDYGNDNTFRPVGGYEFVAAAWEPGTAKLWFRTWVYDGGESYYQFNSDYGTLVTKAWVSDVYNSAGSMTTAVEGNGVVVDDNYEVYVRDDVDTLTMRYEGGASNADKFVWMAESGIYYSSADFNPADGEDATWKLTDATGRADFTFDLTDLVAYDDFYVIVWTAGDDASNDEGDGDWHVWIQSAGFYPQIDLVNTSTFANLDPESYPTDYDVFAKSFKFGDRVSLTYLVHDIWGTPMPDYETHFWHADGNATMKSYENWKRTDAQGYVKFEPVNDETQDLDEFVTDTFFYIEATDSSAAYGWYSSDDVYVNFSKSVTPADLNFEVDDRGDGHEFTTPKAGLHIDTLGADDRDLVEAEFRLVNSDNVPLWGIPVTLTASAGGYVSQGDQYDIGEDVTDMTAGSLTFNSGDLAWAFEDCVTSWYCDQSVSFAGTKVGTATFGISSGSLSDGTTQAYFNLATDGKYLSAVDTEADTVIGGGVVTATVKVTDRFGNPVSNAWIEWSEDGVAEFTSNDDWAWPSQTDEMGLASANLLTPADASGSQNVKAWADGWSWEESDILWDHDLYYEWQYDDAAGYAGGYTDIYGEYVYWTTKVTGLAAGNETVEVLVNWMDEVPTATIKGVKGGVRVFVYNADSYVVKVFVDGKAKLITTADTDSLFEFVKAKAGKHTVKVVIWTPAGKVTKVAKVKVKALK